MKKKFVVCILTFILIVAGLITWFSLSAKEDIPSTPTAKADSNIAEDTERSMPYGFESENKTMWIFPHWTLDGKLFKVDRLSDDFKPLDDRFKLICFPQNKETEVKAEPTDEPVVEVIAEPEEPVVETFTTQDLEMGSDWTLTFYCHCARCNGVAGQPTASGRMPEVGVTVAVDPSVIKLGSRLKIDVPDGNGGYTCLMGYARADDTGSMIKGHKLDVFVSGHQEALNKGVIHNSRVTLLEVQ